jgi:hypothetical protein
LRSAQNFHAFGVQKAEEIALTTGASTPMPRMATLPSAAPAPARDPIDRPGTKDVTSSSVVTLRSSIASSESAVTAIGVS